MDIARKLAIEAEAARSLLLNIADVVADDDEAKQDAIEGETNLKEAASLAVSRLAEISALSEAIKAQRDNLADRCQRLEKQADMIRAALLSAMATADVPKLEIAQATISRRAVPAKVIVTDETVIPSQYWKRADPKLDLRAIQSALKDNAEIPGASMSNGGETVSLKWR